MTGGFVGKIDKGTEAVGKYLEELCPSCDGCPIKKECLYMWDRMAATKVYRKSIGLRRKQFTKLVQRGVK